MCSAFRKVRCLAARGSRCVSGAQAARAARLRRSQQPAVLQRRAARASRTGSSSCSPRDLGATVAYTWWAQRRGFVRNTLKAGALRPRAGMPAQRRDAAAPRAPYYRSTYVFVTRADGPASPRFDDPRAARADASACSSSATTAQHAAGPCAGRRGIVDNVRGYTLYGDYAQPNPPARIVEAVARGRGRRRGRLGSARRLLRAAAQACRCGSTPVQPQSTGRACRWCSTSRWACARRTRRCARRSTRALARRRAEIDAILAEYGVPRLDAPIGRGGRRHEARARPRSLLAARARRPASARSASFRADPVADRERPRRSRSCRCRPGRRRRSAAPRQGPGLRGERLPSRAGQDASTPGSTATAATPMAAAASGPALMDDHWIYGGRSRTSSQTIREGRPNGMPSFRGKIPDDQIWQIAAYVRSMSGNVPKDAAPRPQRRPASAPGREPHARARRRSAAARLRRDEAADEPLIRSAPRPASVSRSRAAAAGSRRSIRRGRRRSAARLAVLDLHRRARRGLACGDDRRSPLALRRRAASAPRSARDRPGAASAADAAVVASLAVATGVVVLVLTGAQLRLRNAALFGARARTARHDPASPATNGGGRSATRTRCRAAVFTTANEIHIPVGEPVQLKLDSADVIHSFWVPNLLGQEGPDPGPARTSSGFAPTGPASIAASAPSSAASSTPIWACSSSPSREEEFERWRDASSRPRRAAERRRARRRGEAGLPARSPASCATPSAARRPAARVGTRPHPCRAAAGTIAAGTLPITPRQSRRLDRRPARHQAGRQHADRSSSSPTSSTRSLAYLEGLK